MFFDLDDTLYPSTSGIWEAIGVRMELYMTDVLGFAANEVAIRRQTLFKEYGTTLRGLKSLYNIDELEFLEYVHDIPLEQYIRRDEALIETVSLYNSRKIIFTNANQGHAKKVLSLLGLDTFFDQIIDVLCVSPYCKPFPQAFRIALELSGDLDAEDCVIIDDSIRNLETARKLGFYTIQVGTETRSPYADAAVMSLVDLPNVIPVQVGMETEL